MGLAACKKETEASDTSVPTAMGAASAKQDFPFQYVPTFEIPEGSKLSLSNQPSWMRINETTGVISGTPDDLGTLNAILVTATSASGTKTGQFDLSIAGDTLAKHQWALENTGQTAFAKNAATAGMDLKAKEAHRFGVLGAGVTVMVSDEGVQLSHEDLIENVATGKSKNYLLADPYFGEPLKSNTTKGNHGTSVSGIIAARGWNGKGTRGVAPEAKIAGANYLTASSSVSVDQVAIEVDQAADSDSPAAQYDVFNYSYGYGNGGLTEISETLLNQLIYGVTNQRGGKGSVYVKSAGNSYQVAVNGIDAKGNPVSDGKGGQIFAIRSLSAEHEEDNNYPQQFVIGALNAKGTHAYYSSSGANLLVSAPGGEDGSTNPAIVTTDEMTCSRGYSPFYGSSNSFEAGGSTNKDCNYTSIFNGTSSAAPHVSGTVALMLSVQPNLTWRDVRHLLIATAVQTDPLQVPRQGVIGATGYVIEDAWVTNGAGFKFNPLYGFGRVDANAAVRAAAAYTSHLPTLKQTVTSSGHCPETLFCADDTWLFTNGVTQAIPNNNATGVTSNITVTTNLKVEAVQVRVKITTAATGDIGIRLTSPMGTVANILNPGTAMFDSGFDNHVLLSNVYYGENSNGLWQLKVFDSQGFTIYGGEDGNGSLVNWSINVLGHDP